MQGCLGGRGPQRDTPFAFVDAPTCRIPQADCGEMLVIHPD